MGAVRLTEALLHGDPPPGEEIQAAGASVLEALQGLSVPTANCAAVGVGGTVTTMGRIALQMPVTNPAELHGIALTAAEVDRQIALFSRLSHEERCAVIGLDPARADIILGGAIILRAAM